MSRFALMPPAKDKKRFEVHFTEKEIKEFEKVRKSYPRMSMKRLMETMLLECLEVKKKKP